MDITEVMNLKMQEVAKVTALSIAKRRVKEVALGASELQVNVVNGILDSLALEVGLELSLNIEDFDLPQFLELSEYRKRTSHKEYLDYKDYSITEIKGRV